MYALQGANKGEDKEGGDKKEPKAEEVVAKNLEKAQKGLMKAKQLRKDNKLDEAQEKLKDSDTKLEKAEKTIKVCCFAVAGSLRSFFVS